jgi:hypothetical protein
MGIKRYTADGDTTIVNAFKPNLRLRGTGSNMGEADVMEVFSIYGREATSSQELSRAIIKFPMSGITTDRTATRIPASGSVNFYLRIFNAKTSKSVPINYTLVVQPVSRSWQEGVGLDLENYADDVKGNTGANWMSSSKGQPWSLVGGDYLTNSSNTYKQTFETGLEDLEIDVTQLVEQWIAGTYSNYGVGVHLTASQEAYFSGSVAGTVGLASASVLARPDGATKSYYTKRFFARGTQFFFKKPVLEARWNSITRDDRGDFYYSSSLASDTDNLNTLYLYNYVRGHLSNIPGVGAGSIYLSLYSGSAGPVKTKLLLHNSKYNVTGGRASTGIYSASICITAAATPLKNLFDVWHNDGNTQYFSGSIVPQLLKANQTVETPKYYMNITNLQDKYRKDQLTRLRLYVRNKFWSPTIYTRAIDTAESTTIYSASYKVYRILDAYNAIPYGTGSDLHTVLSYDVSGNYFDFDMNLLEAGYSYAFKFAFYDEMVKSWLEQPYVFKFRVEDYEYYETF